MKRLNLLEEIAWALLFSLIGWVVLHLGSGIVAPRTAVRLTLWILATGYILHLLQLKANPAGRIVLASLVLPILTGTWLVNIGLLPQLALIIALIWGIRTVLAGRTLLASALDALLCGVSLVWSTWSFALTGSLIAAVWCFLLFQSLFVLLPQRPDASQGSAAIAQDRFALACNTAEAILRELARARQNQRI